MDFYKMAAFMGETEMRARGGNSMMMMGGDNNTKAEVARMSKILKDAGKLRERETEDRNLRQWLGTKNVLSSTMMVRTPFSFLTITSMTMESRT